MLAAGQEAVGELPGRKARVARDVLEPAHAVTRRALQAQRLGLALLLVGGERRGHVRRAGGTRDERDGVLHRELGAGSAREMRRVRGVADEHAVAVVPAPAQHALEVEPGGAAQVSGIAHQPVSVEVPREQLLREGDRLLVVRRVEAVRAPGLLARLDDHRRERAAELVGVDLEPAVLRFLEGEGERGKRLRRAEPDVAAFARVDVRLEDGLVAPARAAVDPVGGDDEAGVGELRVVVDLALEMVDHAELRAPLLQDAEQPLALDAAEPVAAGRRDRAAVVDVDVVPVMEAAGDGGLRRRVGRGEVLHRPVGEHDAPADGVVRPVALVDLDAGPWQGLAEQDGGVQAGGPAPQADDALHAPITGLNSLNVN